MVKSDNLIRIYEIRGIFIVDVAVIYQICHL